MDILISPIVTEKMTKQSEAFNRYGFIVNARANKVEIRKAVEDMYGVTVTDVNTVRYEGKFMSRFTKRGFVTGRRPHYKKAIVTLKKGDVIDFFSNI